MTGLELNIILLCFAVAVCTFALLSKAKPDWDPRRLAADNKTYWILAASLFAIALLVRIWKFGAVPSGMNQDGAMAAVDALALASHGTDRFGTRFPVYFEAWGYGQMSVLLSYLMVPFIKLFGLNSVTARMPMLLASIAGIYVLFRFMEKLFGRTTALVGLLFLAINPWHIMQSRWALDCNLLPHFLLFSLYFLYLGLDKRVYLYLSMVFFAFTMYTYGIAFYSIPLLLVMLCAYLLVKKLIRPREALLAAAVYLLVAWPIFSVVIINLRKLPTWDTGFITMQYFPHSIRTNDLILYSKDFVQQLLSNIRSLSDMALLEKGDFNWNYVRDYGQMYLFSLPFVLLGFWWLVRRKKSESPEKATDMPDRPADMAGRFMLLAWVIVSIVSGLMVNGVNTNRINILFYPMCILAALGICHVLVHTAPIKRLAVAVAVMYAVSFAGFTAAYFGEHAKAMARDFCSGFTDAVKYADGLDTDVLYITSYSREESAKTCSEIYTLFGAAIDAAYFQGRADAYGPFGEKRLPYRERYRYIEFSFFDFEQPVGAVYVFNVNEEYLFHPNWYDISIFKGFGVAVKTADFLPEEDDWDESVG